MSTGDQSMYIRGKLEQRGAYPPAKFMKDGFDQWAESEAPAREGQMEKIPAESQMANSGAMTVGAARRKLKQHGYSEMVPTGGAGIPTPQELVDVVKKLLDFWRKASKWIDDFEQELTDEIIDDPSKDQGLRNVAKAFKDKLALIKAAKGVLDQVASMAQSVGLGRRREMEGGASLAEIAELAKKYGAQIVAAYMWLKNNAPKVRAILGMRSFAPLGKQILDAINPILGAIGIGGKRGKCCCDDMSGGVLPGSKQVLRPGEFTRQVKDFGKRMHGGYAAYSSRVPQKENMGDLVRDALKNYDTENMSNDELASFKQKLIRKIEDGEGVASMSSGRVMGGRSIADAVNEMVNRGKAPIKTKYRGAFGEEWEGNGVRAVGGRKPSARGAIVKQVMREQGLSLPQASKYVKEHNLYRA